jgi:hypothetical protein
MTDDSATAIGPPALLRLDHVVSIPRVAMEVVLAVHSELQGRREQQRTEELLRHPDLSDDDDDDDDDKVDSSYGADHGDHSDWGAA